MNDLIVFDNVTINKTLVPTSKEREMDLEVEDFTHLLEKVMQPLTYEELRELHKQQNNKKKRGSRTTFKKMRQAFACIEKCLSMLEDMNLKAQRFSKIMEACHKAFVFHKVTLKKTVQGTFNRVFKCIKQDQPKLDIDVDNPQPSISTM